MILTSVNSMLTTNPSNWRRVDLWAFLSALCCAECIRLDPLPANTAEKIPSADLNSRDHRGKATTQPEIYPNLFLSDSSKTLCSLCLCGELPLCVLLPPLSSLSWKIQT